MSDTVIQIYNRDGSPKGDAELTGAMAKRSFVLNRSGLASFKLPKTSRSLNLDNLQFGNLITIENDRVGKWGGFLWPNREHFFDGVQVWAKSAEAILSRRVIPGVYELIGTSAGQAFTTLIDMANSIEDTRIRVDNPFGGGKPRNWKWANSIIGDVIVSMQKLTGYDWGIEPGLDNGRLVFLAHFYDRRGQDWNFALEESVNIEYSLQPVIIEQGDIANWVLATGLGATPAVTQTDFAADSTSISLYGLSQGIAAARSDSPSGIAMAAAADLAKRKNPRRTYRLSATDTNSTFDYLGLGDSVMLKLPDYGISAGGIGTDTRVKVLAKEYNDEDAKMVLTLDEVQ